MSIGTQRNLVLPARTSRNMPFEIRRCYMRQRYLEERSCIRGSAEESLIHHADSRWRLPGNCLHLRNTDAVRLPEESSHTGKTTLPAMKTEETVFLLDE